LNKFSVILAVRNGWPYVQECIESVLAQTYPHFELVVLDNQSTDNTVPWLKSLKDPRIRLNTSPVSLSIVESWARVRSVEKQEYMTLIGHDDTLDPGFLATINGMIERNPECALYQTGARLINAEGTTIRSCRPVPERETAVEYLNARFAFQRDVFGTGLVMRSADYDRLDGLPTFERLFFADDALWLSLLRGSCKLTEPTEHFAVRVHADSESASMPAAWSSILRGLNQFADFLKSYLEENQDVRSAVVGQEQFMLTYHRNIYIFALIGACQAGRKIEAEVVGRIEASLAKNAPTFAGRLRGSPKVAIIEALNATPLRKTIPMLWQAYYDLRTRSR
jgi:glycosyltransferase involved in cell wall biosynthesis